MLLMWPGLALGAIRSGNHLCSVNGKAVQLAVIELVVAIDRKFYTRSRAHYEASFRALT